VGKRDSGRKRGWGLGGLGKETKREKGGHDKAPIAGLREEGRKSDTYQNVKKDIGSVIRK